MTRKHTPTADEYVAMYRRCYYNGQRRLVIPQELAENDEFRTKFGEWWQHIAACGTNLRDPYDMAQWLCAMEPNHLGKCFGGVELEVSGGAAIAASRASGSQAQGLTRSIEQQLQKGEVG